MPPKISVCLDVFNYAQFLPRAIESVLAQSCADFELIIADDCSNDGSFEIAQSYRDTRIRLIRNEQNLGMVRNRNVALRAVRGEYVKPLHADDFLSSRDALKKFAAMLDANPATSLVASAMSFVTERGEGSGMWSCFENERYVAGTSVIARCLREQRNLVGGPSTVMFRRDRAKRGFDEVFFHMADLEMWFHLLEQGCFAFLAEPLCAYRRHAGQQTERDRATLSQSDDYDALLARYLDQPYLAFKPWLKRHLRREAHIQRARRCRELGMPAQKISWAARAESAFVKFALRQQKLIARQTSVPRAISKLLPRGINVAGFFASEFGIGESSRAMRLAVEASGLPCAFINLRSKVHSNEDRSRKNFSRDNPFALNLMTFSMDHARRFHRDMGRQYFAGRYNIGLWYWELETLPARFHSSFDHYDEIWVTTEFCRRAIAAVSPIPVVKIAQPLAIETCAPDRAAFGIREGTFVFLFSFDHLSLLPRKNPQAVIEAFRRAFLPQEDAVLALKSINAARDENGRDALHALTRGANVMFLEEHMRGGEVAKLYASVDCYVSLHRSEGLGLGMAQAMSFAKPVIATNYSGNLEFMSAENSLLVRSPLVEIEQTCGPYERGCKWAEPDVEHAAELMRWVFEHRHEAKLIGEKAAADVRATMSVQKTATQIAGRVSDIFG